MSPDVLSKAAQRRAEKAGRLLQASLDQRHAPASAQALAPRLLDELAHLYGVRRWNKAAFVRAVLNGAIVSWQPGTRVVETRDEIRYSAPICPLAAEVDADRAACEFCRAFHRELALRGSGGELVDVRYEDTISHGEASCVAVLTKRAPGEG